MLENSDRPGITHGFSSERKKYESRFSPELISQVHFNAEIETPNDYRSKLRALFPEKDTSEFIEGLWVASIPGYGVDAEILYKHNLPLPQTLMEYFPPELNQHLIGADLDSNKVKDNRLILLNPEKSSEIIRQLNQTINILQIKETSTLSNFRNAVIEDLLTGKFQKSQIQLNFFQKLNYRISLIGNKLVLGNDELRVQIEDTVNSVVTHESLLKHLSSAIKGFSSLSRSLNEPYDPVKASADYWYAILGIGYFDIPLIGVDIQNAVGHDLGVIS